MAGATSGEVQPSDKVCETMDAMGGFPVSRNEDGEKVTEA